MADTAGYGDCLLWACNYRCRVRVVRHDAGKARTNEALGIFMHSVRPCAAAGAA